MNLLPEPLVRLGLRAAAAPRRLALACMLALLTTACGPGSGGTGVGPIAGAYLSFASSSGNSLTATVGLPASSSFLASFDDKGVHLLGSCLAFSFDGAWTETDGEARVTGSYRAVPVGSDLASASTVTATLVARAHVGGLWVSVLDTKGSTLASFDFATRLAEGSHPTPPPPCTSLPTSPNPLPG